MSMTARRERLYNRKFFKNNDDFTYSKAFEVTALSFFFIFAFILVILLIDVFHGRPGHDLDFMQNVSLVTLYYPLFVSIIVVMACCWLPDRCFRPCALFAISQIFLILFIIFHPYHSFVPGPITEKVLRVFNSSYYATFIWIPLLLISLLSCAIISWKASDQSELYTVAYGGEGSSTKKNDV